MLSKLPLDNHILAIKATSKAAILVIIKVLDRPLPKVPVEPILDVIRRPNRSHSLKSTVEREASTPPPATLPAERDFQTRNLLGGVPVVKPTLQLWSPGLQAIRSDPQEASHQPEMITQKVLPHTPFPRQIQLHLRRGSRITNHSHRPVHLTCRFSLLKILLQTY